MEVFQVWQSFCNVLICTWVCANDQPVRNLCIQLLSKFDWQGEQCSIDHDIGTFTSWRLFIAYPSVRPNSIGNFCLILSSISSSMSDARVTSRMLHYLSRSIFTICHLVWIFYSSCVNPYHSISLSVEICSSSRNNCFSSLFPLFGLVLSLFQVLFHLWQNLYQTLCLVAGVTGKIASVIGNFRSKHMLYKFVASFTVWTSNEPKGSYSSSSCAENQSKLVSLIWMIWRDWVEQMKVCLEQVEWARAEKRAFLRQRIELRLASLYLETKNYPQALVLISTYVIPSPGEAWWKMVLCILNHLWTSFLQSLIVIENVLKNIMAIQKIIRGGQDLNLQCDPGLLIVECRTWSMTWEDPHASIGMLRCDCIAPAQDYVFVEWPGC